MFPKDITKWNSNDLMDKIESPEPEDTQGNQFQGAPGPGAKPLLPSQLLHSSRTPWAPLVMATALALLCSQHLPPLCCRRSVPPECA